MARDPAEVPVTFVRDRDGLDELAAFVSTASAIAIDTETPIDGPKAGQMRVLSLAGRSADVERAFVVDARDADMAGLAAAIGGVEAAAWNANFDARVVDRAVFDTTDVSDRIRWWDAQLADALLYQGRTGFGWFHGLAWATERYLGIVATGKGTVQLSYTATEDLSPDQIAYAAADAVETLWVADVLRDEIAAAGLTAICEIEMAARPFLDRMERVGLPFDWESWKRELAKIDGDHRSALSRIAELTGGGQQSLFDAAVEPSWNPGSDRQVRTALNEHATAEVHRFTASRFGMARPLSDHDSVTAGVLREIGGPLSEALLEYRAAAKVLSTYGESMQDHLHEDGRLHSQYLQVVGTNTGRLASRNPNAQNLTPRMKPYLRPAVAERVFVHADLSQAELRFLAQVAADQQLRRAFDNDTDVHLTTAASMFDIDPEVMAAQNPERLAQLRQMAKALNFGIAYGTGAASLARSLTAGGTPTSTDEGRHLLAQYRRTYPGLTAWANERIAEIDAIGQTTHRIDWDLTLLLARSHASIWQARRTFRQTQWRWPSDAETAALVSKRPEGPTDKEIAHVAWVSSFGAPVALVSASEAFTFSSRTVAGRRQQFNLHVDRLFLAAVVEAVETTGSGFDQVRARFEAEHGLELRHRGESPGAEELARQFEDRRLRRRYIQVLRAEVGANRVDQLLQRAATERVEAMVNAWRNAPIQGGVADIMLDAYARLHDVLGQWPSAAPVQTVHDSVVIECDLDVAHDVAIAVRDALEAASARFCPDVRPKADVDIRASLADADVIEVVAGSTWPSAPLNLAGAVGE